VHSSWLGQKWPWALGGAGGCHTLRFVRTLAFIITTVRVKFRGQIRWLAEPAREILRQMRQPDVSMRSSIRAILVR
jgi:hypothetical protein